ncbi:hypothetical protein [Nocardioides abyssi]|uniref:DUF3592 domain-containing protein n=1 Tax=Nocardioides abyssi TaxID=3058370 RepID=A0ABT8ESV5_9ACTN|nr:hypothetical protein [Nocardioides abyssi]MDN4161236.1 hypothetical protein [Nocardioides abyssi]
MTAPCRRPRRVPVLPVVLVAALVNLPVLHGVVLDRQLAADGVDRSVRVEAHREAGGRHLLDYVVAGSGYVADVEEDVYEAAVRTGEVEVRLLPDEPSTHRVAGEVRSRVGLVVVLLTDAALVLMLGLLWHFRGRRDPQVRMVAVRDVERCPPGASLEQVGEDRYVACGDVLEIGDDALVLDLGDRRVEVLLGGHANPVGHQQPARVTGRLLG